MNELKQRAIKYLQNIYPHATVVNDEKALIDAVTNEILKNIYPMIAQDGDSGIKQRLVAIPNLGDSDELIITSKLINKFFETLDSGVIVGFSKSDKQKAHEIYTTQMVFSSRIFIYTDCLYTTYANILSIFENENILVEIIHEKEMFHSLFISYGDPDDKYVEIINNYLSSNGVKTWFFPKDSLPGQKLHRMMFNGVNNYDKVLLVCSKKSLNRNGVLNEIERVLEREAKNGGNEILIPITLDDYVYKEWNPPRLDIAEQIRSRVITKFPTTMNVDDDSFIREANKLIKILKKG